MGVSCDLCDSECNGACEIQSQVPYNQGESNSVEKNSLEHEDKEGHNHEHIHDHHHHHSIYPNSKHPLGPVTLRMLSDDQILRNSVENN